jgi:hypothetical protein
MEPTLTLMQTKMNQIALNQLQTKKTKKIGMNEIVRKMKNTGGETGKQEIICQPQKK